MKKYAAIAVILFLTLAAKANIRLPNIIKNNMVLQQQSAVKLWGWAEPREKIYVTTSAGGTGNTLLPASFDNFNNLWPAW